MHVFLMLNASLPPMPVLAFRSSRLLTSSFPAKEVHPGVPVPGSAASVVLLAPDHLQSKQPSLFLLHWKAPHLLPKLVLQLLLLPGPCPSLNPERQ